MAKFKDYDLHLHYNTGETIYEGTFRYYRKAKHTGQHAVDTKQTIDSDYAPCMGHAVKYSITTLTFGD